MLWLSGWNQAWPRVDSALLQGRTLALEPQRQLAGHRAGSERGTTRVTRRFNRINGSCWWVTRGSLLVYSPGIGGESDTIVLDGVECLPQDSRTWLGQGSELPAAAPVTVDLSREFRREEEGLQRWQRRVAV